MLFCEWNGVDLPVLAYNPVNTGYYRISEAWAQLVGMHVYHTFKTMDAQYVV